MDAVIGGGIRGSIASAAVSDAVRNAEIVASPKQKAGGVMRVDKLKEHIHRELFGSRFPDAPSIMEWKEQRKQEIMRRSVKIMLRHDLSEKDIVQMLEDKFFLSEEEAREFVKNNIQRDENKKEGDSPCQY